MSVGAEETLGEDARRYEDFARDVVRVGTRAVDRLVVLGGWGAAG